MSKKKHREKRRNENENMFGMNPQIMDMLRGSNIDMNKVSAIMGAMNQDGFDINSLAGLLQGNGGMNLPNLNNSQMDLGNISSMLKNMDMHNNNFGNNNGYSNNSNNNNDMGKFSTNDYSVYDADENIEMLLIVKSVVNPKKARFLERVIEMYKNGEIDY